MTTLRTAAQQALEALEIGYDSAQAEAHQFHAAMAGYKPQRHAAMDADVEKIARAITDLKAALAEPVQEPHLFPLQSDRMRIDSVTGDVGIGTPIAEPVQEPVAWEQFHEHMTGPFYRAPPQRKPHRTVTYVCPVCAASLERQE